MKIGNFNINSSSNIFIIAELSANHSGSKDIAIKSILAAKKAGADCIKFQTYTADTITLNSRRDDFKIKGTIWNDRYLHSLYKEAYTPWEWQEELFEIARNEGLECFSSPFDKSSVDFLESLNTPAYKIASFEITDIPLIKYVASKGKPVIISTGIASSDDIELAIKTCKNMGNNDIALLKCTSSYPAPINEANLIMIKDLADKYNVITGISDHTIGSLAPVIATTLGAKIIEKHFILDRSIGGPDSSFSMDEKEFNLMVNKVRDAEKALGKVNYNLTSKQIQGRDFSRSLYVVKDVNKGDVISENNVKSIRPGYGLHPKYLEEIIGMKFNRDLKKGNRMSFEFIKK
tara:strand:+ start:27931 stop:28971 length:1041 start_codon:yes stop_codon:yes gene_type:complete